MSIKVRPFGLQGKGVCFLDFPQPKQGYLFIYISRAFRMSDLRFCQFPGLLYIYLSENWQKSCKLGWIGLQWKGARFRGVRPNQQAYLFIYNFRSDLRGAFIGFASFWVYYIYIYPKTGRSGWKSVESTLQKKNRRSGGPIWCSVWEKMVMNEYYILRREKRGVDKRVEALPVALL